MQHLPSNDWDSLTGNALLPSIGHSRNWLEPMFEHHIQTTAQLVSAGNRSLQAIAALKNMTLPAGITLPIAQSWDAGFLFSGTPLISGDNPEAAMIDLLANAREKLGAKAVLFKKTQHDPNFDQILNSMSNKAIAGYQLFNIHQRAALECKTTFEDWYSNNFSRKRRKEYRRLRTRLAETGNLQSNIWQPSQPIEKWVDQFLELEASGWKGRSGTAIACHKEQAAHVRHALPKMAQNGSLVFWNITLDGKPIASMFGFLENNQIWLGKMAFDETLSQYSPGVLIILDATKDLLSRKNIKLADSSAEPDHPMINNIWRDRVPVADYLIATPGTGKATFKSLVMFETNRLKARQAAKSLYYKLKAGMKK